MSNQMARSTANVTGVTGETPSGSGPPKPASGFVTGNKKASKLCTCGPQGLDATRSSVQKIVSGPHPGGNKVGSEWRGTPKSGILVKAPPPPGP